MSCDRSYDKGKILLKSPVTNIRKIIQKAKPIDTMMGSKNDAKRLSRIEEAKSEVSDTIVKESEVSSVREAIINFDTKIQKIKDRTRSNGSKGILL
jgi:hypothetical protein